MCASTYGSRYAHLKILIKPLFFSISDSDGIVARFFFSGLPVDSLLNASGPLSDPPLQHEPLAATPVPDLRFDLLHHPSRSHPRRGRGAARGAASARPGLLLHVHVLSAARETGVSAAAHMRKQV